MHRRRKVVDGATTSTTASSGGVDFVQDNDDHGLFFPTKKATRSDDEDDYEGFHTTSDDDDDVEDDDTDNEQQRRQAEDPEALVSSLLVNFWYTDLPPLYGILRFTFYMSLLIFILLNIDGSFSLTFFGGRCNRHLKSFYYYREFQFPMKHDSGLFGWFVTNITNMNPTSYINCYWLDRGLRYGLFFSAIGLGGKVPRIGLAICWWTMFGIQFAAWGKAVGHGVNLAGIACIALCFAENNFIDMYSVDSLLVIVVKKIMISNRYPKLVSYLSKIPQIQRVQVPQPWDGKSPSPGRAARKMIVFQATCAMFFAGVHKVSSNGWRWCDGQTVIWSIGTQAGFVPFLQKVVVRYKFIFGPLLGTSSVVGELAAITALFSPTYRPIVVFSWISFHVGIMILMHPNFTFNCITYMLCIDWKLLVKEQIPYLWKNGRYYGTRLFVQIGQVIKNQALRGGSSHSSSTSSTHQLYNEDTHGQGVLKDANHKTSSPIMKSSSSSFSVRRTSATKNLTTKAYIYTGIASILFLTSLLRIDYFPFTSWALYNWHPSLTGSLNGTYYTERDAKVAASRCLREPPLNPACDNHGGTPHYGLLGRPHNQGHTKTVLVTQLKNNVQHAKKTIKKDVTKKKKADDDDDKVVIGHCEDDELRVYLDWQPYSCVPQKKGTSPTDAAVLTNQIRNEVLRLRKVRPSTNAAVSPFRKPRQLPGNNFDFLWKPGFTWRVRDAVAASIEEGPTCFVSTTTSSSTIQLSHAEKQQVWRKDPSLTNTASRLAQRFRVKLGSSRFTSQDETVVGVGILFDFLNEYINNTRVTCKMGESFIGDLELVPNHGVVDWYDPKLRKHPKGNWNEIWKGFFIVWTIFSLITVKYYLDSTQSKLSSNKKPTSDIGQPIGEMESADITLERVEKRGSKGTV